MDARLSLFYRATHIPVSCFREHEIIENHHGIAPDFNLPLFLFESLPDALPLLWHAELTEHALFGGFSLADGRLLLLGPVPAHELSRGHVLEIMRLIGRKPEDLDEMMRYFDFQSIYNEDMLTAALIMLSDLLDEPIHADPVHVSIKRSSKLPPAPSFDETETESDPVMEEAINGAVRHGQPEALRKIFAHYQVDTARRANTEMPGILKSYAIGSIVLASREAVRGGMDYHHAMRMYTGFVDRLTAARYAREQGQIFVDALIAFAEEVRKVQNPVSEADGTIARSVSGYIQGHLHEPLSPTSIAAELGYTTSYLCTAFRKQSGMTVSELINKMKIEEAKRLLDAGAETVGSISLRLGYSSQSYFSTVFRRYTGMTPLQYAGSAGKTAD